MRVTVREAVLFGFIVMASGLVRSARAEDAQGSSTAIGKAPARASRDTHGLAEARSPAFETLADGSSRLSVELSQTVAYDTKAASRRILCVMKGARARRRNDYNPLVTVNFNTPVTSARLMPHGRDLWFVVDLRAAVKPEVKTDAAKDGGMVLQIEFPKGDYVAAAPDSPPTQASAASDGSDEDPSVQPPRPGSADSTKPEGPPRKVRTGR